MAGRSPASLAGSRRLQAESGGRSVADSPPARTSAVQHDQSGYLWAERSRMNPVILRPAEPSDLCAVAKLFDTALGSGFWSLHAESHEYCQLAVVDGVLTGAGAAALVDRLDEAPDLPGPVGLIRLVAVHETSRRKGVATRLVESLSQLCLNAGASSLASFAWVRGDSGICALAGVLTSLGFERLRRLDSFYAGEGDTPCPACHHAPCVCSADLYMRMGDTGRDQVRIASIADYGSEHPSHKSANEALAHAADALDVALEVEWLSSPTLRTESCRAALRDSMASSPPEGTTGTRKAGWRRSASPARRVGPSSAPEEASNMLW